MVPNRNLQTLDAVPGVGDGTAPVFRTRTGFVLVAAGSAVGLGNMWRFPYMVSQHGGAAFLLVYGLMTVALGIPLLVAEIGVGRRSRRAPPGAFRATGGGAWGWLGVFFVASAVLISSYYSVIAGWTLRYAVAVAWGGLPVDAEAAFTEAATGATAFAYTVLYLILILAVILQGLRRGIERAAFVLMPLLVVVLGAMAAWVATLDGVGGAYRFYLLPSRAAFTPATLVAAAGQTFFSLGLGMGVVLTFGSYLRGDEDLLRQAGAVALADLGVAVLAGLVTVPLLFLLSGAPGDADTIGALFLAVPSELARLGVGGRWLGVLFFTALAVAAITSGIPAVEAVTRSLMEELQWSRTRSAVTTTAVIALLASASAWSLGVLGVLDRVAGQLFLIVGGLGLALFVGWRAPFLAEEMGAGSSSSGGRLARYSFALLRYMAPATIGLLLILSLREMAGGR